MDQKDMDQVLEDMNDGAAAHRELGIVNSLFQKQALTDLTELKHLHPFVQVRGFPRF